MVNYTDKDGNELYSQFILRVLDAKLHVKEKDCRDALEINQNESYPYGIGTLFAQFVFAKARNKKVDRYIPIEAIRTVLVEAFQDYCDVNVIIDDYLPKEAKNSLIEIDLEDTSGEAFKAACYNDASNVFNRIMDTKREQMQEQRQKYDIAECDGLLFYKKGDTIHPSLMDALGKSYIFYHSMTEEECFKELMNKDTYDRCSWLVEKNRCILIRDIDWERIFTDIENAKENFARYYPMVRVEMDSAELVSIVTAMVLNDDIYDLCNEISAKYSL